nr:sensor histidine kinase [Microbacterium endophyticum]
MTPTQRRSDVLLAVALCLGAVLSAGLSSVAGMYGTEKAGMPMAIAYAFVLAVPLAFRRRFPSTVAIIVAIAYFAAVSLRVPEIYAGNIAMFIMFYTVGAWDPNRRRAKWTRVAITAGMFTWLLISLFFDASASTDDGLSRAGLFSPYAAYMLINLLINVLYFGGAYYFGERTWAASEQLRVLEVRTAELERERARSAAQAVELERVRLARELHDVVAHHVSLMGVQAGAARTVLPTNPDAAARTLTQVEDSARTALTEMRHLLQTLRAGDEPDAALTAPSLSGLERLVAESSAAGLRTTFQTLGEPRAVPATAEVNLYRIAQEALTNARRHGGHAATADVRLRYLAGEVELEVSNTGRIATSTRSGMGHRGMRERAIASGGTIELLPVREGGFIVRVRVPIEDHADE